MDDWKLRALENVSEGIVITDATKADNPIVFVNQGFRNITGYSDNDVLNKNCRFMRGPGTSPEATQQIRDCIKAEVPFSSEILNYKKDGTSFWNLLNITPLRDESGRVTHFVGIQLDITRTKVAEELLEHSRKKILAAERLGTTVAISGALAHEIFNPLTVVLNRTETALKLVEKLKFGAVYDADFSKLSSHLTDVRNMAERIQRVVQKLEYFYEGIKPKETDVVDLALCLESALSNLEDQFRADRIEVIKELDGSLYVQFNPYELQTLFSNLLVNSKEAIAHQAQPFIKIKGTRAKDRIRVTFTDSAPVIPEDLVSKIFMPFFTTKEAGTGLGLSVASMLALKNGGLLSLEREAESNVFALSLPAKDKSHTET